MPSGVGFLFGGLDVVNLTPKQEKFAQCVADGMTQADAYRNAYDCGAATKPETIQNKAHELMKNQLIKNRVRRLRLYAIEAFLQKQADNLTPELLAELAELAMQDEIKPKKQGAFSSNGKINRYAVFYAANFKCQACGASPSPTNEVILHVDHILPKSKGGTDDPLNLQALCADCNLSKSNLFAYDHANEVDLWKP